MLKRRIFLVSFLILALTLSGCFGGSALKEITISASADEVEQGKSITLAVKGVDKKKKEVTVPNPKWELSDETKGKLSADGVNATFEAGKEATGKVVIKVSSGKLSDEITIKIIEAKKDPEPTPVDKNDLASAIQEAETILNDTGKGNEPGQAPEAAHTALATAVTAAKAVNDNKDATQEQVDKAVSDLNKAIADFKNAIIKDEDPEEPSKVNKDNLIQTINEANGLLSSTPVGIYQGEAPVHAHNALQNAVNEAIAVRDNDEADQDAVDQATATLNAAITNFDAEIVTKEDPIKVHPFPVEGNIKHFTTNDKRGTVEVNTNKEFIKTGTESINLAATGAPYPLRVRVSHPNWITDWTEYDHLAAWFYVENIESLHEDVTIVIGCPNDTPLLTLKRSDFVSGWNEIVVNLRDDLNFTDDQLQNMNDLFEFVIRFSGEPVPVYFDEIRLLQLEEKQDDIPVDKAVLESTILEAQTLKDSTPQGTEPGQAPKEAHTALADAIAAAQVICDTVDATQTEVDEAVTTLLAAIDTFNAAIVEEEPPGEDGVIFRETFNNVPDGTNINNDKTALDNPDSFVQANGGIVVTGGIIELKHRRMELFIPGLAQATNPVLKLVIKNDNGNGEPVDGLVLYIGNSWITNGIVGVSGQRAYGEYSVDSSDFITLTIPLKTEFTNTERIQFRPTLNGSSTNAEGFFIDEIIIVDL